jgi:hypothetical protein
VHGIKVLAAARRRAPAIRRKAGAPIQRKRGACTSTAPQWR